MKRILCALVLLMATPAVAQVTVTDWRDKPGAPIDAAQVNLDDFKWQARPLIVFADSPFDPAFTEQMDLLTQDLPDLIDRDILWVFDTAPDAPSDVRKMLRPHGFGVVLIGKDGGMKLRNALPWDMREISRVIDKMPMRQREVEERRGDQMDIIN